MRGHTRTSDLIAIGLMVLSSFLTSIGDALVKLIGSDVSVWQLYVMRSSIALPLLVAIIATQLPTRIRPVRPLWLAVRSVLMVVMWVLFYAALPTVGLGVASAGLYTFPLFLVLISAALGLGRLGGPRVAALVLGFVGVLLVLQPTRDVFSLYSLLPIGAAVCYALQALVTRHRCAEESPWIIALAMNLAFPIAGSIALVVLPSSADLSEPSNPLAFLSGQWYAATPVIWLVMVALAAIIVAASASMAAAYQQGDSPVVATFDYSHLIFATLWGAWFFREALTATIVIGMACILISGVMVLLEPRSGKPR